MAELETHMEYELLALGVVLIAGAMLGILFFHPLIDIAINGVIIYVCSLKAYADLTKRKKTQLYIECALIAAILTLLTRQFLPFWWISLFCAYTVITAQVRLHVLKK